MAVNSINSNHNSIYDIMQKISNGKKINSAKDDAAGLAIMEKIEAQIRGLDQGTRNAEDMGSLLQTAEGGLSTINDSLQRVRELSIQASSGIMTDSDKQIIQTEIDGILKGVTNAADRTEFNTMKLLDGSFANKNTASNPSGVGMQISIENTSLETLGLKDFSVIGDSIDLSAIDNALSMVNSSRSNIGAMQNTNDYVISANMTSSINHAKAKSTIGDADIALEVMKMKQNQVKEQYQIFAQKKKMEQEQNKNKFHTFM